MLNRMIAVCVLVLLSGAVTSPVYSQGINTSAYSFGHPDRVYTLPKSLSEISGLTLLDRDYLGAIHDEKGSLFAIDIQTGQVTDWHMGYGKKLDYEGVERVGDRVYVLSSTGTIYEIRDWKNSKRITARYETGLSSRNNNEGLAYDASNHRLLIVCKDYPGKDMKGYKAVYAFDLESERLLPKPVFKIDLAQVEMMANGGVSKKKKKPWWKHTRQIRPAALAIHPLTGELFIVSSAKRRMIVLNSDGTLAAVYKLPKKYFVQAEGLVFLPNGDLFISNERADREAATLLRFNYRPER